MITVTSFVAIIHAIFSPSNKCTLNIIAIAPASSRICPTQYNHVCEWYTQPTARPQRSGTLSAFEIPDNQQEAARHPGDDVLSGCDL